MSIIPEDSLFAQGEYDHIVFNFDGNIADTDDIGAVANAAVIAKTYGIAQEVTFNINVNYFNESEPWQVEEMRKSADFAESLGIEVNDFEGDVQGTLDKYSDILNSGKKILVIEGGPVTATYDALKNVDPANHHLITLLSHSDWNEGDRYPGTSVHTWSDIKKEFDGTREESSDEVYSTSLETSDEGDSKEEVYSKAEDDSKGEDDSKEEDSGIKLIKIVDQNGFADSPGKGFHNERWSKWLDNLDPDDPNHEVLTHMRERMIASGVTKDDVSDAGMFLYSLLPDYGTDKFDKFPNPYDLREIIEDNGIVIEKVKKVEISGDIFENGKYDSDTKTGNSAEDMVAHVVIDNVIAIEAEHGVFALQQNDAVNNKNVNWIVSNGIAREYLGKEGDDRYNDLFIEDSRMSGDGIIFNANLKETDQEFASYNVLSQQLIHNIAPIAHKFTIEEGQTGIYNIGYRLIKSDDDTKREDQQNDVWSAIVPADEYQANSKAYLASVDFAKVYGTSRGLEEGAARDAAESAGGSIDGYHLPDEEFFWTSFGPKVGSVYNHRHRIEEEGEYILLTGARSSQIGIDQIQLVHQRVFNQSEYSGRDLTHNFDYTFGSTSLEHMSEIKATIDQASINAGEDVVIAVLANDTSSGNVTITGVSTPDSGTVTINSDNTITYKSDPHTNEDDWVGFTYTIRNEYGQESSAYVDVNIFAVDDGDTPPDDTPPDDGSDKPPVDTPPDDGVIHMELGKETVFQENADGWFTVTFEQVIEKAVVVMGPISWGNGDSAFASVRNVTDYGFEFQISEWDYQDGARPSLETVSWMAMSEGVYTLDDGTELVAGSTEVSVDSQPENVRFDGYEFANSNAPIVFSQVTTDSVKNPDAIISRNSSVTSEGFQVQLQTEEAKQSISGYSETVDWIAIGDNNDPIDFDNLETELAGYRWVNTGITLDDNDVLLADMQTIKGTDAAVVRYKLNGENEVLIRSHEDQSYDWEQYHAREKIGIMTADEGVYDLNELFYV